MFSSKTTKNSILNDGTEITLSLIIKSNSECNTLEELKTVSDAARTLYKEVLNETLRTNAAEMVNEWIESTEKETL